MENVMDELDLLPTHKRQKFLQIAILYHFRCVWPGMRKLPKITSLLFLCSILRKNWVVKLIFCTEINIKFSLKFISIFWASRFPARFIINVHDQAFSNYPKKQVCFVFCCDAKHSNIFFLGGKGGGGVQSCSLLLVSQYIYTLLKRLVDHSFHFSWESLLNSELVCSRALRALRTWHAHVLGVLTYLRAWHAS